MNESVQRIEPALIDDVPSVLADLVADVSAAAARLGSKLHPRTASHLAQMVRIMNTYYSNLIEGHHTRPRDIERALNLGKVWPRYPDEPPSSVQIESALASHDIPMRDLLVEAVAHVRVQEQIDQQAATGSLQEPSSEDYVLWIHRAFYEGASENMLRVGRGATAIIMTPGKWRIQKQEDVAVGQHLPPASERVADFMAYFAQRYRFEKMGTSSRILATAAAHHRFNYIHPFPDGNGRVSRLMSHAMAHKAGIGAHGLWSISRGLARGIESRGDYKRMMNHADMPRQGDLDGRGNLSLRALTEFCQWFLKISLDQINFMTELMEMETLAQRLSAYVAQQDHLKPEAARLLHEALIRGEFGRGDISRITGLPERSARRVFSDVLQDGLLASDTPKGPVSLRFPTKTHDVLFPRLFQQA
jgi:Fic family protein